MDWHLNKVPASWDHLAELEHDAAVAATAAAGPSAAGVHHHHANADAGSGCYRAPGGSSECSVDLKLGRGAAAAALAADRRSRETAAAGKAPAPAGPAAGAANKRPRPATGGGGAGQRCPPCAVDGCKADLSRCRDYHRRHKVCEAHSKTPVVVVAGREMRFCQQCSRFHLLGEFDEAKRSCRKRLDGHNRRRRKPQPDPMTSASFITGQQGTRFSAFTTPRREANWPGIIKTEESPYYAHHQIPMGSSTTSTRQHFVVGSTSSAYAKEAAGRRSSFPFVQQEGEVSFASTGVVLEAPAACQPLLKSTVAAVPDHPESGSNKMMFSSDVGMTRVLDSDCALSLLSAPAANSSGVDVGGRIMVRSAEHQLPPVAHHPLQVPQFGSSSSWFSRPHHQATTTGVVPSTTTTGLEGEQQEMNAVLGANDGEMNYSGMFHVGGEGSSDGGTSSSLPFSWQ